MCSPPSAMEKGGTRKRPQPSNPSQNQLRSFARMRFNSGTGPSSPTKAFHGGPGQVPFQAVSPHGKAKNARTEEKDHEFQKSSPLHPQPSETEETSEYLRDFQEISDKHKSLVSLFTSCMRSISPEEVNKFEPLDLCQKSVSMNLNAAYYQHAAMEYLERVHYELNRLRIEKKMLQDSNLKLENDLLTKKSEAREAKAQVELEMIKERKRAEEEKVRADTLVAQIEKLLVELQKAKAALEEEKEKVSKLSEGMPALEVASVQAFKESKEFTNLMFEQFARGYDDCRTVIEEHNFRLDLSWMDVEDVTNERTLS